MKNIAIYLNENWLIDNVSSGFMNIVVGILICLFINLFTTSEKNLCIWISIIIYIFSLIFLLISLYYRDSFDKKKQEIFQNLNNKNYPTMWENVKSDNEARKYLSGFKKFLIFFILFLIAGFVTTMFGNNAINEIRSNEYKYLKQHIDSLEIINKTMSLEYSNKVDQTIKKIDSLNSEQFENIIELINNMQSTIASKQQHAKNAK